MREGWRDIVRGSLLLACCGVAPASGEESALVAELTQVRAAIEGQRWEEARTQLVAAVEEHSEHEGCVPAHWTEIRDTLARCMFWVDYQTPTPEEVVAGELMSWNPKTGKIKLRYRAGDKGLGVAARAGESDGRERTGDFYEVWTDMKLHPMLFKGTYTVELRGRRLGGDLPVVIVGFDWTSVYGVVFGPHTAIFEFEERRWNQLDSCTTSLGDERGYHFEVKLAKTSVTAFANGKRLLRAKRKGDFGQFGFTNFSNLEEVLITGEVEPSWIAGQVDAVVQADWAKFRESFNPFDALPRPLQESVRGDFKRTEENPLLSYPILASSGTDDAATDAGDAVEKVHEYIGKGKFVSAKRYIKDLESKGEHSPAAIDWLRTILGAYQGKIEDALEHCEKVCVSAPHFVEGRLFLARLTAIEHGQDAALELLEQLSKDHPEYADVWITLGQTRLFNGDIDGARGVYEEGLAAGLPAEALGDLERTRLCALHGPLFGEPAVHESKHFQIVSDMGEKACYAFAAELEKFHLKYTNHVWRLPSSDNRRFPVFIFSGLAGYETYGADLYGSKPENQLGQFNSATKQLLIWNSPDRRKMMRTIRHEGFHQYLDRVTSEAPVWLNEGMAEYFEQSELVRGRWKDDQINEEHVSLLERVTWTPLRTFVHQEHFGFRSRNSEHYAQAWALVHYLYNGPSKRRKIIDALIEELAGGAARMEAIQSAFEGVDLDELESEVRAHVLGR